MPLATVFRRPARPRARTGWAMVPILMAMAAVSSGGVASAPAFAQQQPHQLCKPGHNYDQPKGLCYDPAAAYKADIPKSEDSGGGIFSGIGSSLGLGNTLSFCQYGDQHVGSGDQAYCVSRRTGQPYPASR